MQNPPQNPPQIFDRALYRRRLIRAAGRQEPADFLFARTLEDCLFRLSAISRDFPRALDLGSPHPALARALARDGRFVLRAAPVLAVAGEQGARLVADEERLPFAPHAFDLVVSALGLHVVNDLPGVLAQIRRALAPDGLFLAAMVGGRSLYELRQALALAQDEIEGGASPRVAPFVDLRDLGALLQRAGYALPVTDSETLTVRYPSALHLMRDLRAMGATNTLIAGARRPLRRAVAFRAAEIYAENFADEDGRVRATFEIVWLSGWAPHESQQKPLAPGSAKMSLAEGLARARRRNEEGSQ